MRAALAAGFACELAALLLERLEQRAEHVVAHLRRRLVARRAGSSARARRGAALEEGVGCSGDVVVAAGEQRAQGLVVDVAQNRGEHSDIVVRGGHEAALSARSV